MIKRTVSQSDYKKQQKHMFNSELHRTDFHKLDYYEAEQGMQLSLIPPNSLENPY